MFRERQQIIICIVAAVLVCGFVLFRYLPVRKQRKTVEQARTAQTLVITKASTEGAKLPDLKQQLQQLQEIVGNYERLIPQQRELGMFLQKVTNLMNKHNLADQVIQPGAEIKTDTFCCIPVNMQCKGRLAQIFEFYEQLQSLDRLIRIEKVRLLNDEDLSGEVAMETKAIIYYKPKGGQS